MYVRREGSAVIVIVFADGEPYCEESLKLVNASVMTFRKKQ
jgi:hypothetical protein